MWWCRERLFGTGSQTNAFTDFHHTVYFACCPVETLNLLGRPRPMLPMALDALSEVSPMPVITDDRKDIIQEDPSCLRWIGPDPCSPWPSMRSPR
jgi:hypothetical protein